MRVDIIPINDSKILIESPNSVITNIENKKDIPQI